MGVFIDLQPNRAWCTSQKRHGRKKRTSWKKERNDDAESYTRCKLVIVHLQKNRPTITPPPTHTHTLLPPPASAEVVCRWRETHSCLGCSWWTHKWYYRQTGNWVAGVPRSALPYWWATGPHSNRTRSFLALCTGRTHRGFERRPVSARHRTGPGNIHPVQSEKKNKKNTRKCYWAARQRHTVKFIIVSPSFQWWLYRQQ